MARREYNQMYKSYEEKEFPLVNEETEETEKVEEVEEVKETKVEDTTFINGIVIGGKNLNVREKPNGNVVDSLPNGTKIQVMDDSNPDWYKLKEPKGYVMKKFVEKED